MTITETAISRIQTSLPTGVTDAKWEDPCLTLKTTGWTLVLNCAWRITDGGKMLAGSDDEASVAKVYDLIGRKVVTCAASSLTTKIDFKVGLEGGLWLEFFSSSAFEPWVLRLEDVILVASPSDPAT